MVVLTTRPFLTRHFGKTSIHLQSIIASPFAVVVMFGPAMPASARYSVVLYYDVYRHLMPVPIQRSSAGGGK